jgi:hypothetical protein
MTRPPSGGWTGYLSAFSRTFFGERNARPSRIEEAPPVMQDTTPEPPTSASEAVQHLARTIEHFEALLESLEQRTNGAPAPEDRVALGRGEQDVLQRLDDALTHLGSEAARMSEGATQLSEIAYRLQENLSSVSNVLERSHEIVGAGQQHVAPSSEPRFAANGSPVDVVLAGVPGFQGLMDVQRALASMASAEAASVVGYRNGEATLEVLLRDPVTAQEIVDALRVQTGHTLLVEEALPEDLKLRLRFAQ